MFFFSFSPTLSVLHLSILRGEIDEKLPSGYCILCNVCSIPLRLIRVKSSSRASRVQSAQYVIAKCVWQNWIQAPSNCIDNFRRCTIGETHTRWTNPTKKLSRFYCKSGNGSSWWSHWHQPSVNLPVCIVPLRCRHCPCKMVSDVMLMIKPYCQLCNYAHCIKQYRH